MSKIEVIGPRDLLLQVLETIRGSEALQVDPEIQKRMEGGPEARLRPLAIDPRTLGERLFYEDLDLKIVRLLSLLPETVAKTAIVNPPQEISAIAAATAERIALCEATTRRRDEVRSEMNELNRYAVFLSTVLSLVPKEAEGAGLDVIAVEVRDRAALERLTNVAGKLLLGAEVRTTRAADGSYIGLITTEKQLSDALKETLRDDHIPEVALPSWLEGLTLSEKIKIVHARHQALVSEDEAIERELGSYAEQWRDLYTQIHQWLQAQLALLKTTGLAYGTDNCFVLFGWIPEEEVANLRALLTTQFGETVIVEEKETLAHDLATVPVTLKNRPYFQPFELLVRLLPLPRYASIDPTPFIGIFFPIFFGMILGDIGYGLVLFAAALGVIAGAKGKVLQQAGRILFTSSLYTIVFGVLYGEFFGDAGAHFFGLRPWIDRRESLMPTLYFAVAVGTVHIIVGTILGVVTALRGKHAREAAVKIVGILLILCVVGILASYYAPVALLLRRPLLITMAVLAPVLLVTGGLLAPLELLKSLGNIVSYARIMAVGLASVLLAYVANSLAGAAGSIWVGIVVAVVLHAFNIVLGVFAPTIHSLRLHYVEFFGKFFEPGGRPYLPLKKS